MGTLSQTTTQPPIYFVSSESDYRAGAEDLSAGLAAEYVTGRRTTPTEMAVWEGVFERLWPQACRMLAEGLKELGVDSFAVVPNSRAGVRESMRSALRTVGLTELPTLIAKAHPSVSYAGKDEKYIAATTLVRSLDEGIARSQQIAVCDDFAGTGKTLFGLYRLLTSHSGLSGKDVLLAAVGVSSLVDDA